MKFPKKFYSFKDGVDISNKEIENKINEMIDTMEKDFDFWNMNWSAGNTYISVNKYWDDEDISYYYSINVCKNYWNRDSKIYKVKKGDK